MFSRIVPSARVVRYEPSGLMADASIVWYSQPASAIVLLYVASKEGGMDDHVMAMLQDDGGTSGARVLPRMTLRTPAR